MMLRMMSSIQRSAGAVLAEIRAAVRANARAAVAASFRIVCLACAIGLAAAPAATLAAPRNAAASVATGGLPAPVDAALARAKVPREAMVAWVEEVGTRQPRVAFQTDRPVNPASLMKLVTTFAALDLLGPAYTWSTPVWLRGPVVSGVLDGDLVIRGTGDPKLVLERLWLLMRRVQQMGVREIRGDIVVDRNAFKPADTDPGEFDGEPLRPYNAGADALLLNFRSVLLTFTPDTARGIAIVSVDPPLADVQADTSVPLSSGPCDDWRAGLKADVVDPNRLGLRGGYPAACGEKVWPMAFVDPKSYNARALAGMWRETGGRLTGVVRDGTAPATPASFELKSPALAEIVRDINKHSNNVMAQQLFLTLGATQAGDGSPDASREVVRRWLQARIGNDAAAGSVVRNGSGLSRDSRLTARGLGRLLQAAWASPVMPELMSSLPVAGVDGTLKKAKATPGRAHLKTGSLRDVAGIAGYVLGDSGRRYVVVAIVNEANANAARPAFDALVDWVAADEAAASAQRRP